MKVERIVQLAGIHSLICGVLHVMMPFQFPWAETIALLPVERQELIGAPLNIMNWCMAMGWALLAYILIRYAKDMIKPGIGRAVLASMVIFWVIRIAVLQPVYMGMTSSISTQMLVFFVPGLVLYAVPLARSFKTDNG